MGGGRELKGTEEGETSKDVLYERITYLKMMNLNKMLDIHIT